MDERLRIVVSVVVVATVSLLATACGGSNSHLSTLSAQQDAALAFSQCMRTHGVANFPDPDTQGAFPQFHAGVSKHVSEAANTSCKHLLSRGGGTATPAQRQQKVTFGLKVAECLRAHGYPDFPDPTGSNQTLPPGLDLNSPQFQTAEANCEQQSRKALGLP
jgi:hypothetical protein